MNTTGAILAALLGGALARRVSAQQESLRLAISALALLALGATSYAYVPVWSDNLTNFTAQAETLPDGQRRTMALTRLGRVQFERNDIAGAIASFVAATASDPEYPDIELPWNYASALVAMKLLPEAPEAAPFAFLAPNFIASLSMKVSPPPDTTPRIAI